MANNGTKTVIEEECEYMMFFDLEVRQKVVLMYMEGMPIVNICQNTLLDRNTVNAILDTTIPYL